MQIVKIIQEAMVQKNKTLILAESCTGGFLAHLLTSLPGSSAYFLGSFVTYSNSLKINALKVSEDILYEEQAVGEKTVLAMLKGAFEVSNADFGLAVSGVAGPSGGRVDCPVGTIYVAFGTKEKSIVECLHLEGTREEIIYRASYILLELLYKKFIKELS